MTILAQPAEGAEAARSPIEELVGRMSAAGTADRIAQTLRGLFPELEEGRADVTLPAFTGPVLPGPVVPAAETGSGAQSLLEGLGFALGDDPGAAEEWAATTGRETLQAMAHGAGLFEEAPAFAAAGDAPDGTRPRNRAANLVVDPGGSVGLPDVLLAPPAAGGADRRRDPLGFLTDLPDLLARGSGVTGVAPASGESEAAPLAANGSALDGLLRPTLPAPTFHAFAPALAAGSATAPHAPAAHGPVGAMPDLDLVPGDAGPASLAMPFARNEASPARPVVDLGPLLDRFTRPAAETGAALPNTPAERATAEAPVAAAPAGEGVPGAASLLRILPSMAAAADGAPLLAPPSLLSAAAGERRHVHAPADHDSPPERAALSLFSPAAGRALAGVEDRSTLRAPAGRGNTAYFGPASSDSADGFAPPAFIPPPPGGVRVARAAPVPAGPSSPYATRIDTSQNFAAPGGASGHNVFLDHRMLERMVLDAVDRACAGPLNSAGRPDPTLRLRPP